MNDQHGVRLKELVHFTASSLETGFPSPFGCPNDLGARVSDGGLTLPLATPSSDAEPIRNRDAARI